MELDIIRQLTTWNDAAESINKNFAKLRIANGPLDTSMSDTSKNGVENKVLKEYIDLHPKFEVLGTVSAPDIIGGGGIIILDSMMSDTSENGVQNRVIKAYVDAVSNRVKVFEEWFKPHDENTIITDMNFVSSATLSSGGVGTEGGGGEGSSVVIMESWDEYDATLPQVLGSALGVELNDRVTAIEDGQIDIDLSSYAKISYVDQSIDDLVGGIEAEIKAIKIITSRFEYFEEGDILKTTSNLVSEQTLSSGGVGTEGGGGEGSSVVIMESWDEYDATLPQVLGSALGVELNDRVTSLETSGGGGGGSAEVTYDAIVDALGYIPLQEDDVNTMLSDYLPIDGEAASATKLADDTAYTAWGRTFFQNGKPVNVTSSPILARNGGLYAYDYKDESTMLMWYLSDSTKSEFILGHQSSKNLERTRICGYPISFHIGNYKNASDIPLTPAMLIDEEGDVTIKGNLIVEGTVASGGAAQPTESELSALEARIAALEEIING